MTHFLSIIIVLFVLSMINERVVTFVKLYFSKGVGSFLTNWLVHKTEDLSVKHGTEKEEKIREMKILRLNIIFGIIVATCANANFFEILKNGQPGNGLGWLEEIEMMSADDKRFDWLEMIGRTTAADWLLLLYSAFGFIFTGLFISLGSKFWHDLLDLLLQVKNLKGKLADKETYEIDNVEQLDEFLALPPRQLVTMAFLQEKEKLKQLPGVLGAGIGRDAADKPCIEVMTDSANVVIPPIQLTLASGKTVNVPVEKIIGSVPAIHLGPSEPISNQNDAVNKGSIGCVVHAQDNKNKKYLLTCYHVVKSPTDQHYESSKTIGSKVTLPGNTGTVTEAVRNAFVDAALVETDNATDLDNQVPGYGSITAKLNVYDRNLDEMIGLRIYTHGITSQGKAGVIKNMYFDARLDYSGKPHELQNLLVLTDGYDRPVSKKGDSGAPVLDMQNNIIGIIVGGNDRCSFAIPIQTILNSLKVDLNT